MKKIILLLPATILLFVFTGCGTYEYSEYSGYNDNGYKRYTEEIYLQDTDLLNADTQCLTDFLWHRLWK